METNKRKALGKGLEQLFSNESLYENPLESLDEISHNASKEDIVELNLSELRSNPYQPRQSFDEDKLRELSESIKEFGVLEPIIVKKSIKGYEIVAGERRCKAASLAGLNTIPAIIKDLSCYCEKSLPSIEEAEAYSNLIKTLGISQEELARRIGKSRSYITNMLGLLKLPQSVKNDVLSGNISMGHARALSKLEDNDKIIELANKIKDDRLSVRELEEMISNPNNFVRKNPITVKPKVSNEFNYVEDALTDKIGNRVRIKNKKIVIPFNSEKDLERILEILNIEVKVD